MSDYIQELQAVFLSLHGCSAKHKETVPVLEEFQGQTVWQGEVEVFELSGHPKAKIGYGWGYSIGENDQGRHYITAGTAASYVTANRCQSRNHAGDQRCQKKRPSDQ